MNRLSLRAKLFAILGMLSVTAILIAVVGMNRLGTINDSLNTIVEETSTRQMLAARMRQDLLAIHRAEKAFILAKTAAEMDQYADAIAEFEAGLAEHRSQLEPLLTAEGRGDLEQFGQAYQAYQRVQKQVRDASRRATNTAAYKLSTGEGRELFDQAEQAAETILDRNEAEVAEAIAEVREAVDDAALKERLTEADLAARRALLAARMTQACIELQREEKNLILAQTTAAMDEFAAAADQRKAELDECLAALEAISTDRGREDLGRFRKTMDAWLATNRQVVALSRENSNNTAMELSRTEGREQIDAAEAALKAVVDRSDAEMLAEAERSDQVYAAARMIMLAVSSVGILLGVLLGWYVVQGVIKSFKHVFQGLKGLSTAELSETAGTFNRIIDGMTDGVEQVTSASTQVSSASQELAEGASEQAASLEETSSSVEEITSMIQSTSTNSRQAADLANDTRAAAASGNETMAKVSEASDEIGKIIKTIDEIAFQTNLLALNAAVEAARAGEAGKGFAVVAEEVRTLARRSAEAARETSSLIENATTRSQEGVAAMEQIGGNIEKLTELITGIDQATTQQASGIEQINVAVNQMDKVTQANAASAEESASASEELNAQAESTLTLVNEMIAILRGSGGDGQPAARSAAAATAARATPARAAKTAAPPARKAPPAPAARKAAARDKPSKVADSCEPEAVIPMEREPELAAF